MLLTYRDKLEYQIILLQQIEDTTQSMQKMYQAAIKLSKDSNSRSLLQILTQQRFDFSNQVQKEISMLKTQAELMRFSLAKTKLARNECLPFAQPQNVSLHQIIQLETKLFSYYEQALSYFPTSSSTFVTLLGQKNQIYSLITCLSQKFAKHVREPEGGFYQSILFSKN